MPFIKKILIQIGVTVGVLAVLFAGVNTYFIQKNRQSVSAVSIDEAKSIAVRNAGARFADAKFIRFEKDRINGREVYDVEFYTADGEFDYVIDATTGRVIERDTNGYGATQVSPQSTVVSNQNNTTINNPTTQVQAVPTAPITQAAPAPQVSQQSPSPTAPAVTQPMLVPAQHPAVGAASAQQNDAANRALADAGLHQGSTAGLYTEFDYEDGYPQYEVEFYDPSGYVDYDYTIDAATGQIIERSYDSSWDD